jgi:hypothetical protein
MIIDVFSLVQSAIFDLSSMLTVLLLFICTCSYVRGKRPNIFDDPANPGKQSGFLSLCWKASRIGERASPLCAGMLIMMALYTIAK